MNSLNIVDWNEIQKKHNEGVFWNNLPEMFGTTRTILERGLNDGHITKIHHKKIMSDEERNRISIGRSKFLKENPDKHPWKNNNKFKSVPCERFKKMLLEKNILFLGSYRLTALYGPFRAFCL